MGLSLSSKFTRVRPQLPSPLEAAQIKHTPGKSTSPEPFLSLPFFLPSFSPSLPSQSLPSFLSLFLSRVSFQKMGILFFHLIQSQILAPPLSLFFLSLFVFTAHNQPSANVVTSVPRQAHPNLFPSPRLLPSPGPHLIPDCHHPLEKTLMLGLKVGEKGTTEDEMAGWHHRLKGRESE